MPDHKPDHKPPTFKRTRKQYAFLILTVVLDVIAEIAVCMPGRRPTFEYQRASDPRWKIALWVIAALVAVLLIYWLVMLHVNR